MNYAETSAVTTPTLILNFDPAAKTNRTDVKHIYFFKSKIKYSQIFINNKNRISLLEMHR